MENIERQVNAIDAAIRDLQAAKNHLILCHTLRDELIGSMRVRRISQAVALMDKYGLPTDSIQYT